MMSKFSNNIIFIVLIFTMLLMTGCSYKAESTENTTVSTESENTTVTPVEETVKEEEEPMQDYSKLFELNLYSDKTTYQTTDKIKIWATLKYIGEDSQIKIWHGIPYISFFISDGKDFDIGGLIETILTSTELEKGKFYHFDYSKNGGFSADDPKAEFWKKFYAEKDLYLPEGEYTIKVATAFSLTEKSGENESSLSKEFKIVVKRS